MVGQKVNKISATNPGPVFGAPENTPQRQTIICCLETSAHSYICVGSLKLTKYWWSESPLLILREDGKTLTQEDVCS